MDVSLSLPLQPDSHSPALGQGQGQGQGQGGPGKGKEDFQLFSWDDDEDLPQPLPHHPQGQHESPFASPLDHDLDVDLPSHQHQDSHPFSPSLMPLPDLVPDSPGSPNLRRPFLLDPTNKHESYYRSSSAPVPDLGPRTSRIEYNHNQTLYSPAYGAGALNHRAASGLGPQSTATGPGGGLSQSLGASWNPNPPLPRASQAGGGGDETTTAAAAAKDNNQSPYLSYHLGDPFALSPSQPQQQPHSTTPRQGSHLSPPPSAARLASLANPSSAENTLRKTVSPQEAFLDYEDVDHALHSNPRYSAFGAVGVGAGAGQGSLFAPLPTLASAADGAGGRGGEEQRRARSGSPMAPAGSAKGRYSTASRFSVPRNAVSWESTTQPISDEDDEDDSEDARMSPPPTTTANRRLAFLIRQ
ncbi:hypothetical protein RQP46_002239 [Phenoliferia psychrophenolica]